MSPFILLAFIVIPIFLSIVLKSFCTKIFIWGLFIAPISTGLYSLFFIKYIGNIFVLFLPISMILNKPAWWFCVEKLNIINGNNITFFDEFVLILFNGIFWGSIFYFSCFIFRQNSSLR